MEITSKRYLTCYDARAVAIREDWFTSATNTEYEEWLNNFSNGLEFTELTDELLYKQAEKVWELSNLMEGYSKNELIANIMFILAKASSTTFDIKNN